LRETLLREEVLKRFKPIFYPKSIAVVGALRDPNSFGARAIKTVIDLGYPGKLYPINPKVDGILGLKVYPSVTQVPGPIEFATICVPAHAVPKIMEECVEKGVKAVHIYSAGFSETGTQEGRKLEEDVVEIAKKGDIRVIGPNCEGIYCPESKVSTFSGSSGDVGSVGFFSQSGGHAMNLLIQARVLEICFSKVVSYGNACDLDGADFLEYFAEDPKSNIIAMYIEGVKDGRRFFDLLKNIARKKPTLIFKGGVSKAGARAAESHTGALAGSSAIWDAVFKQTGAVKVSSRDELANTLLVFLHQLRPSNRKVAFINAGGGNSVFAADTLEQAGLEVPTLLPNTIKELRQFIPIPGTSLKNPLDLHRYIIHIDRVIRIVAKDSRFGAIIVALYPDFMLTYTAEVKDFRDITRGIIRAKKSLDIPLTATIRTERVGLTGEIERLKAQDRLIKAGIPVFSSILMAAKAIANAVGYQEFLEKSLNK